MSRLHRRVLKIVIREILTGERRPGEMLPPEKELAAAYDMSRGVAREVIRGLEERGLISVRHGRGAAVNQPDRWNTLDPDVLGMLLVGPSSAAVLREFLECRRIFEIEAAGLAAERADSADLVSLKEALEQMEVSAARSVDNPDAEEVFHQADTAFHLAVIRAAKNSPLTSIATRIHSAMVVARYPLARPQDRLQTNVPEHAKVLEAIERRDPAASRQAMAVHLDTVGRYLGEFEQSGGRRYRERLIDDSD